jgi:uncharacterized membrane protein YkvA (DUF1232 family)/transcriptional regulator with XRE-family HTH domain
MADVGNNRALGPLLRDLLKERSLSMRKLSEITEIDTATISRIINGKRKANLQHLERFADCLDVPLINLFEADGYSIEQKNEKSFSDIHTSIDAIQGFLKTSNTFNEQFSIEQVEKKLENYGLYSQTEEGRNTILNSFEEKIVNVGSIGPFISRLKELYERFCLGKDTSFELVLIGSALLYFIIPVDVIPDYIFPIGYLDDAIAIQLATNSIVKK